MAKIAKMSNYRQFRDPFVSHENVVTLHVCNEISISDTPEGDSKNIKPNFQLALEVLLINSKPDFGENSKNEQLLPIKGSLSKSLKCCNSPCMQ